MCRTAISGKFFATVLLGTLLATASCATHTGAKTVGRKFHEENVASLIIRYSSDQAIYLLKPDEHEGPFYRIYSREQLCDAASRIDQNRDLAVVVIGYSYSRAIEQQICQGWIKSFASLNYHRVVFLRANNSDPVNKLRVVEDDSLVRKDTPEGEVQLAGIATSQPAAP